MEDFDKIKKQLTQITTINKAQNSHLVDGGIMTLIRGFPIIGDLINTNTVKTLNNMQEMKQKELMDVILSDKELITSEKVNNIEFIMEFIKMIEVVNKLASNEKVVYIANLFRSSFIETNNYNTSEFEEYLFRLNDLSLREINILVDLYNNSFELERFYKISEEKHGLNKETINAILSSITRSGFCSELGGTMTLGYTGDFYFTTPYFEAFLKKIKCI